ncbi:MAG: methylmalonyl-CoA epimerase [Candidatus Electryonea clarkiae]|nr:methylmalonyl-CoA epimerase [Candidatus Electryonea clarkiae]MDP8288859.1 methylmalonyl-CoA epimerase [Candidatus Electryonea clarkiae]
MIKKIGHIGIAVPDLEEGIQLYRDKLGLKFIGTEVVEDQKVKVAMFEAGDVHIELLEPTGDDSPIAAFLQKTGGGMHHICYEVDDVDESLMEFEENGIRLIDKKSRPGASGTRVGFLHPKSTGRVLTELNSHK